MRLISNDPPRVFPVGPEGNIRISDCGRIDLKADEQVTFLTEDGGEFDVARKDFGFYATPSMNSRLKRFGLRALLVRNRQDHFYVLLVEKGKESLLERYLAQEKMSVVLWMDDTEQLVALARKAGV